MIFNKRTGFSGATANTVEPIFAAGASNQGKDETNDAAPAPAITDALHALLIKRADDLEGCAEGTDEEHELEAITNAIDAYEAVRWPHGKISGGKG